MCVSGCVQVHVWLCASSCVLALLCKHGSRCGCQELRWDRGTRAGWSMDTTHTAKHCNPLQRTATHCNALFVCTRTLDVATDNLLTNMCGVLLGMCVLMCVSVRVHSFVRACVCMYVCGYVCLCVCTCTCARALPGEQGRGWDWKDRCGIAGWKHAHSAGETCVCVCARMRAYARV